jgi:RNA polymerase sporulation-specific sigma factor
MLALLLRLLEDLPFIVGYITGSGSFPEPLDSAKEAECLERMIKLGDDNARDMLIKHNLRLVVHISKKYATKGHDSDDLISIGTIGLIKAVSTFNNQKGTQLATYAARCIENEILMAIRSTKKLSSEVSISEPVGTDNEGNAISLIEILGTSAEAVADEAELRIVSLQLRRLMDNVLTDRERLVVRLRYGIGSDQCLPQREIAAILGISRSYISRIEKKALQKLAIAFDNSQPK